MVFVCRRALLFWITQSCESSNRTSMLMRLCSTTVSGPRYLWRRVGLNEGILLTVIAANVAGVVTTAVSVPMDVVKSQIQNQADRKQVKALEPSPLRAIEICSSTKLDSGIVTHELAFSLNLPRSSLCMCTITVTPPPKLHNS